LILAFILGLFAIIFLFVGALLFSLPLTLINWQGLSLELATTVLLITPPIHLFTNFLAFKLKLKKNPW
jgi:CDP-diglyceride synthetase